MIKKVLADLIMQPPSILQNAASFTEDDRAGIWNIRRYHKSGGSPSGPGYREGQTSIAGSGETYCVPEGTSTCDKPCLSYNLVDSRTALSKAERARARPYQSYHTPGSNRYFTRVA